MPVASLFRRGPFRWMWAGETASMLGDRVNDVALAWLVIAQLHGSPLALSSVLLAGTLPRAALVLVGGALTDRLPARVLLLATNLIRGALSALLAALVLSGAIRLWQLFPVSIAFGIADAFFIPAVGAIVPDLVERDEDLPRANALIGVGEQTTMLAGPALAGPLVAVAGAGGAFVLNALSFLAAAAGVVPASRRRRERAPEAAAPGGLVRDIRDGFAYARSHAGLRVILFVVAVDALVYSGLFGVGMPALARGYPQGLAVGLGVLLAASGAGQLAGTVSATLTGLPRRLGPLIVAAEVVGGAGFVVLALIPSLWVGAVALGLGGFIAAYAQDVALPAWLQRHVEPALLGRVSSLVWLPRTTLGPLSLVVVGAIAAADVRTAFAAGAALLIFNAAVIAATRGGRRLTT